MTAAHDFQLELSEHCPDSAVMDFLNDVHAIVSARMAVGSEATLHDYRIQVRHLQRYFDEQCRAAGIAPRPVRLSDLSSQLLAGAMRERIGAGRSRVTANKLRRAIRAIYGTALQNGWPGKPLRVRAFPEPHRKPEAWLLDEFEKLLAAAASMPHSLTGEAATSEFWVALLLVAFNTGSRIDALMRCPTSGLDLERGFLKIPAELQKHHADEVFELLPQTVAALKKLRVVDRKLPTIFADWRWDQLRRTRGGRWRQLTRKLQELVIAAGLACAGDSQRLKGFHRLRRTFASYVAASAGKAVASQMLGHSCLSVTDRYLDPRITGERRVIGKLPNVLAPSDSAAGETSPIAGNDLAAALKAIEARFGVSLSVKGGEQ